MAKTPTQARGKAAAPENAADNAVVALQKSMDRACAAVADGSSALLKRAARAARAGVPRATVAKAVAALHEAVADLEAGIERAYSAPQARPVRESRVDLTQ